MKITIQFDSLDEFQQHFNFSSPITTEALSDLHSQLQSLDVKIDNQTQQLAKAIDEVYKAGADDVGGKLHKDIKDIDDVAQDYDEQLFLHVKTLFDNLFETYPKQETIIKKRIKDVVGDYEIRPGLSVDAYQQLEHEAIALDEIMS